VLQLNRDSSFFAVFYLFAVANIAQALMLPFQELTVAGLLQVITYLLLLWLRPIAGFAVMVAEFLAIGFGYTGMAFYDQWDKPLQTAVIGKLFLFMLTTGLFWLTVLFFKNFSLDLKRAEKALHQYKKYEDDAGLLTLNEFLYRAEDIHMAMKRRHEEGFLITITICPKGKEFALKTLHEYFSRAALQAVREQYDLVGKRSPTELLLLLQNTNREGCSLVLSRFKEKLHAAAPVPVELYEVQIESLPMSWEYAKFTIIGAPLLPIQQKSRGIRL